MQDRVSERPTAKAGRGYEGTLKKRDYARNEFRWANQAGMLHGKKSTRVVRRARAQSEFEDGPSPQSNASPVMSYPCMEAPQESPNRRPSRRYSGHASIRPGTIPMSMSRYRCRRRTACAITQREQTLDARIIDVLLSDTHQVSNAAAAARSIQARDVQQRRVQKTQRVVMV